MVVAFGHVEKKGVKMSSPQEIGLYFRMVELHKEIVIRGFICFMLIKPEKLLGDLIKPFLCLVLIPHLNWCLLNSFG